MKKIKQPAFVGLIGLVMCINGTSVFYPGTAISKPIKQSNDEERKIDREAEELIAQIETAFANVRLGDAQTLHQARITADYGMSGNFPVEEYQKARLLDPETDWRQIPEKSLDEGDSPHFLMDHEAWRFYLPAYMVRSVKLFAGLEHDPAKGGDKCAEQERISDASYKTLSLVFYLGRYGENKDKLHGEERFALSYYSMLNESQAQAVASFLRFIHDRTINEPMLIARDAEKALEDYWGLPQDK